MYSGRASFLLYTRIHAFLSYKMTDYNIQQCTNFSLKLTVGHTYSISSFMTCHLVCYYINTTSATSEEGTVYPSGGNTDV